MALLLKPLLKNRSWRGKVSTGVGSRTCGFVLVVATAKWLSEGLAWRRLLAKR